MQRPFAACYVINLERNAARLARFRAGLPADWPFGEVRRFAAIDGSKIVPPEWFRGGKGAWGCLCSHAQILENCLSAGIDSVLILEDDAVFCEDFSRRTIAALEKVPEDWELLYLGGQHLRQKEHPPQPVNADGSVAIPFNVNRTHAYAVRGAGLQKVYRHLKSANWNRAHHIDHHLGALVETGAIKTYSLNPWLIGQAAGPSNIGKRMRGEHFWQLESPPPAKADAKPAKPIGAAPWPKVIAVVGPFRSGTSCTAGVLHRLGVSMGRQFKPGNRNNPTGFYEAVELARICRTSFREPRMLERNTAADRVAQLRQWIYTRRSDGAVIGAKHPTLCLMVPDILAAWPNLSIVSVERPAAAAIASIEKAGWWNPRVAEQIIPEMIARRDAALQTVRCSILRLAFDELLADPAATIARIVEILGISATAEEIAAAEKFVKPELNHHG